MKKILLIALLLIPFFGFSQTTKPIDGFLGVKFGSTKAKVLALLKARGAKLDPRSNAITLAFTHISLGHRAAEYVIVRFVNNKAFDAEFTFKPDDNNQVIDYYKSLESDLNDIYGKGEDDIKYTAPYTEGDGHDVDALLVGAAQYNTTWEDANNNTINLEIEKEDIANLTISLTYLDDALSKLEDARLKAKDKGDM